MASQTLILASASPRRSHLLREHGFRFRAVPAQIEEVSPPHLTVAETVLLNAKRKADDVARRHPRSLVMGVDTLVAINGKVLGKPESLAEARRMLARLSGREHQVFTGVWLRRQSGRHQAGFVEMSCVHFRKIDAVGIRRYLAAVDPLDKAGGYAAQDDSQGLIARIEGSRTNVIGLPVERLREALKGFERKA